jgi:hypothetical protein
MCAVPSPPTFTAFHDDGRFDADGQRRLLDFMLQRGGVNAFFVRSGMGQMYTFGMDDTRELVDVACAHLAGKAPCLVGTSGIWDRNYDKRPDTEQYTREAIELSQYALDKGAAGVVLTIPEGLLPAAGETEADVTQRYFERVAAAINGPIFIYQPPGTDPKYHMTEQSIARLGGHRQRNRREGQLRRRLLCLPPHSHDHRQALRLHHWFRDDLRHGPLRRRARLHRAGHHPEPAHRERRAGPLRRGRPRGLPRRAGRRERAGRGLLQPRRISTSATPRNPASPWAGTTG